MSGNAFRNLERERTWGFLMTESNVIQLQEKEGAWG